MPRRLRVLLVMSGLAAVLFAAAVVLVFFPLPPYVDGDRPHAVDRNTGTQGALCVFGLLILGIGVAHYFEKQRAPPRMAPPYPNLLDETLPAVECWGVQVALSIENRAGVGTIRCGFQNRFNTPRVATLTMLGPHDLCAEIALNVPGGAAGEVLHPIAVPQQAQGQPIQFMLYLMAEAPEGQGVEGRPWRGVGVERKQKSRDYALLLAMIVGIFYFESPARVVLPMPAGLLEELPSDAVPVQKISWLPDESYVISAAGGA